MSTEFLTLKECKEAMKGSFIGVVIKQGDLKSGVSNPGTSDEKPWTNKKFTIQDATDEVELTAWGEDVTKFKVGYKYEIVNPWWKQYQGNTQLDLGKFATVKVIGSEPKVDVGQQVIDAIEKPVETKETSTLPETSETFKCFIQDEAIALLQIEKVVVEVMRATQTGPDTSINYQKVGMFVKEIYHESKKIKFVKASQS